jgi:hypothetical protein
MMAERYRFSDVLSVLFARVAKRNAGRSLFMHTVRSRGYLSVCVGIVFKRSQTPEGGSNAFMTVDYQIEVEGETTHG